MPLKNIECQTSICPKPKIQRESTNVCIIVYNIVKLGINKLICIFGQCVVLLYIYSYTCVTLNAPYCWKAQKSDFQIGLVLLRIEEDIWERQNSDSAALKFLNFTVVSRNYAFADKKDCSCFSVKFCGVEIQGTKIQLKSLMTRPIIYIWYDTKYYCVAPI